MLKESSDFLQVQGIHSKGFGIIPKIVMQDKKLTPQAKAIYAYFCSYAGAGKTAFPRTTRIITDLGMGKNAYYKHLNLLKEQGYIKAEQAKDKSGRFKHNLYTLVETLPILQKEETAKKQDEPCPCLRDTEKPNTEGSTTNNNSIKNKHISKNNSLSCLSETKDGLDKTKAMENQIVAYINLVKENIDYGNLSISRKSDLKLVDEIVAIIVDVYMSESKTIFISGESKPRELVKHNLMLLDYDDIWLVLDQFKSQRGKIKKKKQYLLAMLYNSIMELNSHYVNLVESDRWNGGGLDEA